MKANLSNKSSYITFVLDQFLKPSLSIDDGEKENPIEDDLFFSSSRSLVAVVVVHWFPQLKNSSRECIIHQNMYKCHVHVSISWVFVWWWFFFLMLFTNFFFFRLHHDHHSHPLYSLLQWSRQAVDFGLDFSPVSSSSGKLREIPEDRLMQCPYFFLFCSTELFD